MIPAFLFFFFVEYLLRNIPNDYSLKYNIYKKQGKEFETLILGSSYALYDLDPIYFSSRTFNGGHLAQTLDVDASIFHKFEPALTKLKYVIIPISDMSFFFKMKNSDADWRMTNYSIYYKIHESYKISDYLEIFKLPFSVNRNKLISYYFKNKNSVTITNLGFGSDYTSGSRRDLNATALEAEILHTIKDYRDFPDEKKSLEEIVLTCQKRNIRVILFTPPAYSGYVSKIDSVQLKKTFSTCNYFIENYKNVRYFNFLTDSSFLDSDYFDAVHLNEIGAKKMSLIMDSVINQLGN
ncbi:MAG: hypothetical protein ABUT20_29430 [Bacteroidota bacterium]